MAMTNDMENNDFEMEWRISDELVSYPDALAEMEARVEAIAKGEAGELVWLLEHPPLYTAGTSADPADLVDPDRFPVYDAGRGGQYTYHGPGQRVAYFMLDLKKRGRDVRQFVYSLEETMIQALATFGVEAERRDGRVGVWVERPTMIGEKQTIREDKIGAVGVRVRKWVTFHGISVNVEPDLSHFEGIVPCGIADHGVTSLADMGLPVTMDDFDVALRASFDVIFGMQPKPMTLAWQPSPKGTLADMAEAANPADTHPTFQI